MSDLWGYVRRALALASEDNVVVEVGVYDGAETKQLYAAARKPVRQLAFEPDPRSLDKIRRAGIPADVTLVPCAVGAANGKSTMYLSGGHRVPNEISEWDGSSSIRKPTGHLKHYPWINFDQTVEVEVVTLDSYLGSLGIEAVDFLWADVQGAERDLVAGASRTLARSRFAYFESEKVELYEGQWTRPTMLHEMGQIGWGVVREFESDVLFYNRAVFDRCPL